MAEKRRIFPDVQVRHNVVNQSDRSPGGISLIVLHDTEGANLPGIRDLAGLGDFFDRPAVQASSHVANDAEGFSARYVADDRKAWHCAAFNSVSLGIEQIGFASQQKWPAEQIHETARWIARWSRWHDIPIRKGAVSGARVTRSGVVTHAMLGASGGGHTDPGLNYPFLRVLELAKDYKRKQEQARDSE